MATQSIGLRPPARRTHAATTTPRTAATRSVDSSFDRSSRVALVVDDEPAVRDLITRLLSRRGWSVMQAADAGSALAAAESRHLNLVVTDYEMPLVSGLELATRLRLADRLLPIMMVSGVPEAAARILELPGGHTAFAAKPFVMDEFLARIDALVAEA